MRACGNAGGGSEGAPCSKEEVVKRNDSGCAGRLNVIGIGPGSGTDTTPRALAAIESSTTIAGYRTYVKLIAHLLVGKKVVSTGMKAEAERCIEAIKLAASGEKVALVCSGDPGVYGMAGLVLELMREMYPTGAPFEFEVIPGVPSVCSSAAALGAPLMHDFAVISLSDLLTPLELIKKRLHAAAEADFVISLYNPRSKGRPDYLAQARDIIMEHRPGSTPVGIVKDSRREGETVTISTLAELPIADVDMTTMVIIGNSDTYRFMDYMVTPRGYKGKRF